MLRLSRMSWSCCRKRARSVAGANHAEGHFRKTPRKAEPSARPFSSRRYLDWQLALGGLDQGTKEFARSLVFIYRPFGVPLHGDKKMITSSSFQGLDNAVIGAGSHDTQSLAEYIGGLMMGGIHRHDNGTAIVQLLIAIC